MGLISDSNTPSNNCKLKEIVIIDNALLLNIERKNTTFNKDGDNGIHIMNRHALPDSIREVVNPKKVIPMSRRDSFNNLRKYMDKGKGTKKKDNKADHFDENTEIPIEDGELWINNYY